MIVVTLYNLSVKIETDDRGLLYNLNNFLLRFYTSKQASFNQASQSEDKVYVSKVNNYNVFYLHINQYHHLKEFLERAHYVLKIDNLIDKTNYKVEPAIMSIRPNWNLYDYQKPAVEFLTTTPFGSKLLPLQTGKGKGIISLTAISKLGQRTGIVILPTYIEKWVKEICEIHDTTPDKVLVIQGQKSLKALIELGRSDAIENNYIVFSSRTLQEFVTRFETNPSDILEEYGIEPIDLFSLLNIGVLIIDETHQHFHAIFKILLHINVKYHIGLSATLLSDNFIVKKMHEVIYPKNNVYTVTDYDRYIDAYFISYNTQPNHFKFIRTSPFRSTVYSHIVYEQSVTSKDFLCSNYIRIITECIDKYYIAEYKDNDKLIIFVSTVKFATKLAEVLANKYNNYTVNRYCEDDPFDNLHSADIIVSTVISAGTGVDIKNLRVTINTTSISSSMSNIQTLGRLRKLSDRDVKYCHIYNANIRKHKDYTVKRRELFHDKTRSIIDRTAVTTL